MAADVGYRATAEDLELKDAFAARELGRHIYGIGALLVIIGTSKSLPDIAKAGEMLTAAGNSIREAAHTIAQAATLLKDHRP